MENLTKAIEWQEKKLQRINNELEGLKVEVPDEAENKLALEGWNAQVDEISAHVKEMLSDIEKVSKEVSATMDNNPLMDMLFKMF